MTFLLRPALRFVIALVILGTVACSGLPFGGRSDGSNARIGSNPGPKILTMVAEEGYITDFPGVVGRRPGGVEYSLHNYLVVRNDRDEFVPQLATEQLSVERGTWRINDDGTMDATWRIRPGVKWHDGAPFTSDDLVFSFAVFKDPDLPSRFGSALREMESVSATDSQTLVVHWQRPFATANEAPALIPMPKHLLEAAYLNDRASFANSPRLLHEFVGLGPYRLARWEPGSHVELERFDDYFRGRPPLDRVIVRFISDPNTVVSNLLAGTVDVAAGNQLGIEGGLDLRQRWQGTGNQVRFSPLGDLQQIEIQFRPEYVQPRAGLLDRSVRQAFWHAIDRESLVEAKAHGLTPVADHWFSPTHALRSEVESAVPLYPYSPERAQQLLERAGWTRGGDGVLIHSATAERFDLHFYIQEAKSERDQAIVAANWKSVGVQASLARLPIPRDREFESTQPGVLLTSPKGYEVPYLDSSRLYGGNMSTAANRWTGRNRGGYANPRFDSVVERLVVTIDQRETVALHRELLHEGLSDVAMIPLYFDVDAIATQKGVRGPIGGTWVQWNFFEWDKD